MGCIVDRVGAALIQDIIGPRIQKLKQQRSSGSQVEPNIQTALPLFCLKVPLSYNEFCQITCQFPPIKFTGHQNSREW